MFFNVVRLEVTLNGSDFSGWNDLLVSLQCFPNLQHLCVTFDVMGFVDELVQTMWRSPDIVPSCLVNKLEMIKIIGLPLSGIAAGLMLLRYILRNAKVLRKLYFGAWFDEHSQAQELWKERKFCKSLFKLPRSSPTSKVVFSGRFIDYILPTLKDAYADQIVKSQYLLYVLLLTQVADLGAEANLDDDRNMLLSMHYRLYV
uniref:FBD domain-containing protein n=1 Tax=Chenopodium quinoa TaxID=63459 RepID=A0A803N0F8_CHEQI